jgi:RimJ/RimL family protein N-acetyltransferase
MPLPWDFHSLESGRVRLDALRTDDFEALYALHSDPEVCRYLLFEPRTREEVTAVLERDVGKSRLEKIDDYIQPAIRDRRTGELIGTMYLNLTSVDDRTAEMGWLVGPRFQGQGYATECATMLLDLSFGDLDLHRVYAELDPRNEASVAVCRKLGMRQEAHMVEHMWLKGEWTDTGTYAILEREWH